MTIILWYNFFMQDIQLNSIINFAPYIAFTIACLILYLTRKMTFTITIIMILFTVIARSVIFIITGGTDMWWIVIIQAFIATVIFIILVLLMSNVSWETLLIMSSMLAFTPIPDGIPAFLGTYLLITLYGIFKLDFSEIKRVFYDALISSGFGQGLPNYEHLPDKETKKGQARVTLLPFILIAYSLNALYYILSPYWMES